MIGSIFFAAGLSLAQPAEPSRIRRPGEPARPDGGVRDGESEAQRIMIAYGVCVLQRNRRRVDAYLAAPVVSDEARRLAGRIATPECLGDGQLRFAPSLFRGALFNALYKTDHARRPLADVGAAPRLVYVAGDSATLSVEQRAWRSLSSFADCVVRAGPAVARQLVLSDVTSEQERSAFSALRPQLGPCLPQGMELQFSRPLLRGLVAESLYRLTVAVASLNARSD